MESIQDMSEVGQSGGSGGGGIQREGDLWTTDGIDGGVKGKGGKGSQKCWVLDLSNWKDGGTTSY